VLTASRPGGPAAGSACAAAKSTTRPQKGALNSATKQLALELASRGITVNAIAPGIIDAGMAEAMPTRQRSKGSCR